MGLRCYVLSSTVNANIEYGLQQKLYTEKQVLDFQYVSVFDLFIFHEVTCLYFHVCHFYNRGDKIINMYILVSAMCHLEDSTLFQGPGFDTRSGNILSFLLPLFQEGQLSVTGESMCTKYWLTA